MEPVPWWRSEVFFEAGRWLGLMASVNPFEFPRAGSLDGLNERSQLYLEVLKWQGKHGLAD